MHRDYRPLFMYICVQASEEKSSGNSLYANADKLTSVMSVHFIYTVCVLQRNLCARIDKQHQTSQLCVPVYKETHSLTQSHSNLST